MPNQVSGFNSVSKNLMGFLKPLETPLPTPLKLTEKKSLGFMKAYNYTACEKCTTNGAVQRLPNVALDFSKHKLNTRKRQYLQRLLDDYTGYSYLWKYFG